VPKSSSKKQRRSKKKGGKLRTMNEVSAAEAVELFHAAMSLDDGDPGSLYAPIPEGFPKDIAAKDFMDSLALYRQWWSDGEASAAGAMGIPYGYDEKIDEVANIAASMSEKSLEELVSQLSPPQRKVFDRIVDGSHPRLKDLVTDKTLISDETGKQMREGTIKVHVSDICEIFDVPNRKALVARIKETLPSKAEKRPPEPKKQTPKPKDQP